MALKEKNGLDLCEDDEDSNVHQIGFHKHMGQITLGEMNGLDEDENEVFVINADGDSVCVGDELSIPKKRSSVHRRGCEFRRY